MTTINPTSVQSIRDAYTSTESVVEIQTLRESIKTPVKTFITALNKPVNKYRRLPVFGSLGFAFFVVGSMFISNPAAHAWLY